MKPTVTFITALCLAFLMIGCGGKEEKAEKKGFTYERKATTTKKVEKKVEDKIPASKRVDLSTKGVGPIKNLTLPETIDNDLAAKGEEVFKKLCAACHRPDKKFIGPAPKGILERRSPEWVMNMILNPEEMVQKDPLAKELLIEFNGSPMANQNLTEDEARAVLEYFRTLK